MCPSSFTLCLFLCAIISSKGSQTSEENVDLIELNHFYDKCGHHRYDQVIFYQRSPETGRFQVRTWCLIEDQECLNRIPVKNLDTQLYLVDWFDTDQRLRRKITSRLYRESWTQIDPEWANKKFHDERLRVCMIQNPAKFPANENSPQPLDESKLTGSETVQVTIADPKRIESIPASPSVQPLAEALVAR